MKTLFAVLLVFVLLLTVSPASGYVDVLSDTTFTLERGAVVIRWESVNEFNIVGYNVYRSKTVDGEKVRVNEYLIPAQRPLELMGGVYEYQARGHVKQVYWLMAIDQYGNERVIDYGEVQR